MGGLSAKGLKAAMYFQRRKTQYTKLARVPEGNEHFNRSDGVQA